MPPNRTKKSAAAASDASSSTILPRPRGRPRKDAGNVSLSSTVGAPTPGRRPIASSSLYAGNVSLASTAGPSTPAVPKKRGRPSKAATAAAMTHPSMRALTSAASDISASRARGGRPPKSILANRTITSPNSSVSFSDHQRGAPPSRVVLPASARQALASSSSPPPSLEADHPHPAPVPARTNPKPHDTLNPSKNQIRAPKYRSSMAPLPTKTIVTMTALYLNQTKTTKRFLQPMKTLHLQQ